MENMKFQHNLQSLIHMNLKISTNFFKGIKFEDKIIEDSFINNRQGKHNSNALLTDLMIILGYVASLLFIILANYKESMLIMTILNLLLSTILIILSNISKNKRFINIFTHLKIFMININLNLKGIILSILYNTPEDDHSEEILRIIIYNFFSTNLFILVKFESYLINYVFYFLINLITVIIAEVYSNNNHYYYLDALTGFFLLIIFYILRRGWDLNARIIYSEKYKYEKLYSYSIDFINGFNGLHITLKNKNIIYMDHRFQELFDHLNYQNLAKLNDIFSYKPALNISNKLDSGKNMDFSFTNFKNDDLKNKYGYFKINDELNCTELLNRSITNTFKIDMKKNGNIIEKNTKNATLSLNYENNPKGDKFMKMENYKFNQNELKFNLFLDSLKYFEAKKFFNISENFFSDNTKANLEKFDKTELTNNLINQIKIANSSEKKDIFKRFDRKNLTQQNEKEQEKIIQDVSRSYEMFNNKLFENAFDLQKKAEDNNITYEYENKTLLENLKYIQSSQIIRQENFSHLGLYYLQEIKDFNENLSNNSTNHNLDQKLTTNKNLYNGRLIEKQYFEVYFRRIKLNEQEDLICDLLFYDVSALINTRMKFYNDSIIKQKIFSKIVNDFKIPLNSIINITDNMSLDIQNILEKLHMFNDMIKNHKNSNEKFTSKSIFWNTKYKYQNTNEVRDEIQEICTQKINFIKGNLNSIKILSSYLLLQTSDIFQYKNNNDILIQKNFMRLKDLLNFCFDLLNILLSFNKSKLDKIKTEINYDDLLEQVFIFTDDIRLKQILVNFITNAVKFTNKGIIKLDCHRVDDFSNKLKITISDTGIGINEDSKNKIFHQTDFWGVQIIDTEKNFKDEIMSLDNNLHIFSGCGLYISKCLADKLEVEIGYSSENTTGANFFIIVPYLIQDQHKNNDTQFESHAIKNNMSNLDFSIRTEQSKKGDIINGSRAESKFGDKKFLFNDSFDDNKIFSENEKKNQVSSFSSRKKFENFNKSNDSLNLIFNPNSFMNDLKKLNTCLSLNFEQILENKVNI